MNELRVMMGAYIVFKILIFAVVLIVNTFVAHEFEQIAKEKGYENTGKYFWYSFFLLGVGYFMVFALPDRKRIAPIGYNQTAAITDDEMPDL